MKKSIILILSMFLFTSCGIFERVDKKTDEDNELHYMKNIEQIAINESRSNRLSILQPGDELLILVSAIDLDVARPFNQNYSSSEILRDGSLPSGNVIAQRNSVSAPTYRVNSDGWIDFPVLGRIDVQGKTIDQLSEHLREEIRHYIKDPSVNIRQTNYKISVLGEVRNPGKFVVPEGRITLLEALSMAGDMTIFGKREEILVIRDNDGSIDQVRLDLTDAEFINSPYYYMKQGDVIYVLPNKTQERLSKRDPNNSIYISIASILVTILALVIRK